jgi:uncharacterized membrane protein (UPF0136 family)
LGRRLRFELRLPMSLAQKMGVYDVPETIGIIMAIVVGAIVGARARLVLPGRQNISIILTIVVGIASALSAPL